jgi:hypothetical protein
MNGPGNHPISVSLAFASFVGLLSLLVLLLLPASSFAASQKQDVVIHEGEGLWILRQPWPESEAWCQNGAGNPAHNIFYDIYAYYDVPHERRMERLGSGYEEFVRDKVVAAIKNLCGPDTPVTYVVVGMYRKSDATEPGDLVDDLSNSRTQPWDFISFTIDDAGIAPVKYEPKEAMYHLTQPELAALDPRSKKTIQASIAASRISDYLLYEGSDFKITSVFDRPGRAWCEHVYVAALVVYDASDDALDQLFKPDYESFLQAEIVPKIKEVCPTFPDAAEYFKQSIRLEFTRAGESRVASFMGFSIAPDGTVSWSEGRKTQRQITQAAAQREEQARQASVAKATGDFIEVECDRTITGYMHVDTVVPYVKMVSILNQEESNKLSSEMADCFDALTTMLQLSNPYASSVKFDVFDNSGKSFVQSEVQLTPTYLIEPSHQPEKLRLFSGHWKTEWYEAEIGWDWRKSEFIGVVDNVSAKGATLGFKEGEQILVAKLFPDVLANEVVIALPTTLTLAQTPEPWLTEGGLVIHFESKNMMMFSQGKGDDSIVMLFERVDNP